ncbi:sterol desaturase family protein [Rapidithrix thailandica]|uniref:Sterol desaturase family protein n=1 Tax=Rapidithrix thailandica TaxID=413964 RepID=A0AAW9RXM7_9BACT
MENIVELIRKGYVDYASYLWREITHPHWKNYFYWLLAVSLFFFLLELLRPWRKGQAKFRKDFWLDFFYMFFNFFLFSLLIYNAATEVLVNFFNKALSQVGMTNLVAIEVSSWPVWGQLLSLFVVRDFIHWWVHRLLHRNRYLWEFHKVHHSVEQMGFAAHLRFHWMETVVYRSLEYIPLAMIGFGIDDFFIVHIIALSIGHFNHANFTFSLGPFKYLFNNPAMHIWHHAYYLPEKHKYGANFGLSLSIWDYLFGTAYLPKSGRNVRLGFPGMEDFPHSFWKQAIYGFRKLKK